MSGMVGGSPAAAPNAAAGGTAGAKPRVGSKLGQMRFMQRAAQRTANAQAAEQVRHVFYAMPTPCFTASHACCRHSRCFHAFAVSFPAHWCRRSVLNGRRRHCSCGTRRCGCKGGFAIRLTAKIHLVSTFRPGPGEGTGPVAGGGRAAGLLQLDCLRGSGSLI